MPKIISKIYKIISKTGINLILVFLYFERKEKVKYFKKTKKI